MSAVRRMLVPIDFSEPSRAAFEYAAELARRFEAEVHVLHVWEAPTFVAPGSAVGGSSATSISDIVRKGAERALDEFVTAAINRGRIVHSSRAEAGHPAHAIVDAAAAGRYDLIVLGTHGRTGLSRALIGSVAERVVRHAPCPVLTVRSPHPEPAKS